MVNKIIFFIFSILLVSNVQGDIVIFEVGSFSGTGTIGSTSFDNSNEITVRVTIDDSIDLNSGGNQFLQNNGVFSGLRFEARFQGLFGSNFFDLGTSSPNQLQMDFQNNLITIHALVENVAWRWVSNENWADAGNLGVPIENGFTFENFNAQVTSSNGMSSANGDIFFTSDSDSGVYSLSGAVPEPSTYLLFSFAFLGLVFLKRK